MDKKFLTPLAYSTICGALFALVTTILRVMVIVKFSANTRSSSYYLGILVGILTQWLIGSSIAFIYWLILRSRLRIIAFLPLLVLVFINITSFHYEAFFFRLPGSSVLDYIKELSKIKSSLTDNAPLSWVFAELLLTLSPLLFGFKIVASWVEKANKRYLSFSIPTQSLILIGGIFVYLAPGFHNAFYWGSRETVSYFQLALRQRLFYSYNTNLQLEELSLVREQIGLSKAKASDLNYPLCENHSTDQVNTPNHRNVIFIIMEGVDQKAVEFNYKGVPLMPNLASIAHQSLSFQHFFAAGSQSAQAMPSIFSGQPVQSENILIKQEPMLKMSGFPAQLSQEGYSTCYFHGSNLTYENQDLFLKMIGFNEFNSFNPLDKTPVYGWGYSDGEMFSRLQEWIINHQKTSPQSPYLATFFTASTHDPYNLPSDYKFCFDGENKFSRFADSVHYFDKVLGDFYSWYLKEEAPKGTLLVITSDHIQRVPYPNAPKETSTGEFEYSFHVPLVIAGLSKNELQGYQAYTSRYGSHIDLPSTLLYLLGYKPIECYAGLNLLTPQTNWNDNRFIVSVAPDDLRFIYVQKNKYRWMYDLTSYKLSLCNTELDPYFQKDILQTSDPKSLEVEHFIKAYKKLNYYLAKNDAYSFENNSEKLTKNPKLVLTKTTEPNYIAEWNSISTNEANSLAKIKHAMDKGFNWIELPIKITRDKKLVLLENNIVTLKDGSTPKVGQFMLEQLKAMPQYAQLVTLDQVFEMYGSKDNFLLEILLDRETLPITDLTSVLAELAEKLKNRPKSEQIIINILASSPIRATIGQQCNCDIVYQMPSNSIVGTKLFSHISQAGYTWVYLESSQASSLAIAQAHQQGLKVMIYINSRSQLTQFGQGLPDGAIIQNFTN